METVSVLIATSKPSLYALLNTLKGQNYYELIIDIEIGSPAIKRNNLAKKATGDILLFLDDDIVLSKDFIQNGLKQFTGNFAQSKVTGLQENSPDKFIGTAMWFRKDFFFELGGFDETIPFFNEDLDLYIRAKKLGSEPQYLNRSVCFHETEGHYEKLVEGNRIIKEKHPDFYEELKKELR